MRSLPRDAFMISVLDAIATARVNTPSLRWFLFGSILTGRRPVGDVDLLVIYASDDEPAQVRHHLSVVASEIPLHVIFMTADEEIETHFIEVTRALEL